VVLVGLVDQVVLVDLEDLVGPGGLGDKEAPDHQEVLEVQEGPAAQVDLDHLEGLVEQVVLASPEDL
jgi:hypothetical protein